MPGRMSSSFAALMVLAALGCGGGDGGADAGEEQDGGGQPGVDSGAPQTDGGGDQTDGGGEACGSLSLPALTVEEVAPDVSWNNPVFLTQPAGDDALYVVEQPGLIRRVTGGTATEFLDLTDVVDYTGASSERGLLGLAFHPQYADNGRFFVYYTEGGSGNYRNVVAEYRRDPGDPAVADPTEVRRLIDVDDPASNHNGGMIAFGPDGFLYVAMGDGGGGNDNTGPAGLGNAQDLTTLLGKIHRLDVDDAAGDFAAAGNPFGPGTDPQGLPQIWAYGLRNPWRFSFDRATGNMWIGDVGQGSYEEVDFAPASSSGGENYGWAAFEGFERNGNRTDIPAPSDHVEPILAYAHEGDDGDVITGFVCSVVGGYVYRGSAIPALQGWYLFGDYCNAQIGAFKRCDGEVAGAQTVPGLEGAISSITSFGEDASGELYMLGSDVVRIVAP